MLSHAVVVRAVVVVVVTVGLGGLARVALARTVTVKAQGGTATPGVNPRADAVNAFNKRIASYVDLRKKAESGMPGLTETDDPGKIMAREKALGDAIRKLRATAKAGELFGKEMTPLILEIVRADWKRRPAADRAAILAGMEKPFVPTVNMRYPVGQPLMTFPPTLLKQLQELPEDLEYRFVGRDLILRDVKANIIVDVIRHAIPSPRAS